MEPSPEASEPDVETNRLRPAGVGGAEMTSWVERDEPPAEAVIVTVAAVVVVAAGKVAEEWPAAMPAEDGIVAGPLEARLTVTPGAGAGADKATVQVEDAPAVTGLGEQERDDTRTGARRLI